MSVDKWAYDPAVCDGDICVGDCDLCDKPKIAQIHNTATTQVQTDYIERMTDKEFIDWLIDYIYECDENGEELVSEVICRKLIKAGALKRVEIDGEIYHVPTFSAIPKRGGKHD